MDLTALVETAARSTYEAQAAAHPFNTAPAWDDLPAIVKATVRETMLPVTLAVARPLADAFAVHLRQAAATHGDFMTPDELAADLDAFLAAIPA